MTADGKSLRAGILRIAALALMVFGCNMLSGSTAAPTPTSTPTPEPDLDLEPQSTQPGPAATAPSSMDVDCDNVFLPVAEGSRWTFVGSGPAGSWAQETTFNFSSSSRSGAGRLVYEFHAAGPDEITVPAGTFPAVRIEVKARMETEGLTTLYDGTMWLVPEIGRVKETGETHVDGSSLGVTTVELQSYNIP